MSVAWLKALNVCLCMCGAKFWWFAESFVGTVWRLFKMSLFFISKLYYLSGGPLHSFGNVFLCGKATRLLSVFISCISFIVSTILNQESVKRGAHHVWVWMGLFLCVVQRCVFCQQRPVYFTQITFALLNVRWRHLHEFCAQDVGCSRCSPQRKSQRGGDDMQDDARGYWIMWLSAALSIILCIYFTLTVYFVIPKRNLISESSLWQVCFLIFKKQHPFSVMTAYPVYISTKACIIVFKFERTDSLCSLFMADRE